MIVTARRIPVPDPMAPKKSANTVSAPIHSPKAAAWECNDSTYPRDSVRCPFMNTDHEVVLQHLEEVPDTSIQVFENRAHDPRMNVR